MTTKDRSENKKIKVTEVFYFKDDSEMDKKARSIIEKKNDSKFTTITDTLIDYFTDLIAWERVLL